MRSLQRRCLAVAILPLLVLLLSGWTAPGGWYCADGVKCEPATSAGCCCEEEQGDPGLEALASSDCGCYFNSPTVDVSTIARAVPGSFSPALITALFELPQPRFEAAARSTPPPGRGPPGDYLETRSIRGPPVA